MTGFAELATLLAELEAPDFIIIGMGAALLGYFAWRLTAPDALVEAPSSNPRPRIRPLDRRSRPTTDHPPAQSTGSKRRLRRAA
ncbi:hypothetical protein D1F64_21795 [Breoghania sp. L-A4]|nr:hypothetical protein D1F64_21795 [Breoghania sp. L-A4]